jgi:hypothetical protein
VVEGCERINVRLPFKDLQAAALIARDQRNDLAVLRINNPSPSVAAFRGVGPVRAGDAVVASGYPLSGLLATAANLAVGNVSALAGLGDDSRYLQISAPVQPGNSGGPLLDSSGHLVGIVASKLNAASVARVTGDIPQNVNFAIKAEVARAFLDSTGVAYQEDRSDRHLSPADVGDMARPFTVYIECHQAASRSAAFATSPSPPSPSGGGAYAPPAMPRQPVQPPQTIRADVSKLKFSDIRQLYPSISPEEFQVILSNAGPLRITAVTIGFRRIRGGSCSFDLATYDGFKKFDLNLAPSDSAALTGQFSAEAKTFCIVNAFGVPAGGANELARNVSLGRLKISSVRQLYPSISPEDFQIIIGNGSATNVGEITIGYSRELGDRSCPADFQSYDGFKTFSVALVPGDSATVTGKFSSQAKFFCVIGVR